MDKANFRSSIATCNTRKSNVALVDPRGTHNFFFNKDCFLNYKPIQVEQVSSASGDSIILDVGTVFIPLDGGMDVEGYHAPHFSTNIFSVGKCGINPQNNQGFIQRPKTWPGVDTTDPESGRKVKVGKDGRMEGKKKKNEGGKYGRKHKGKKKKKKIKTVENRKYREKS